MKADRFQKKIKKMTLTLQIQRTKFRISPVTDQKMFVTVNSTIHFSRVIHRIKRIHLLSSLLYERYLKSRNTLISI